MNGLPLLFLQILSIQLIAILLCNPLWSVVWAYRDAEGQEEWDAENADKGKAISRPVNQVLLGTLDGIGTNDGIDGSRRDYMFPPNQACVRFGFPYNLALIRNPFGCSMVIQGMNDVLTVLVAQNKEVRVSVF